jgi:RimJ/RimL family protein N-acetyltransferase
VTSPRILLRQTVAADRDVVIEMETDAEVRRYLGGPRDAADVAAAFDEYVAAGLPPRQGSWAIALASSDERIGFVLLHRRDPARPGHVVDGGSELELSYGLRRSAWGHGYALEACRLLLADAAASLPDQPVVVATQAANAPSLDLALRLGFEPVSTFEEFDAEQRLLSVALHSFRAD